MAINRKYFDDELPINRNYPGGHSNINHSILDIRLHIDNNELAVYRTIWRLPNLIAKLRVLKCRMCYDTIFEVLKILLVDSQTIQLNAICYSTVKYLFSDKFYPDKYDFLNYIINSL